MGKKGFAAVVDAFWDEASDVFAFLASEFGLNGPERSNLVIPAITYTGGGVRYEVMLDTREKNVDTSVNVALETETLDAPLEALVAAAGLGARNHVTSKAATLSGLRHTLELHAQYMRLLMPYMTPEKVVDLMRAADAREWTGS
ncbi:hypothetical protein AB0368_07150 [Actinoplanes sp. NPDC051475]|uniref:hypothetical protein n=1 Tax=Actinoplanes sp. NPDC051475 TaxID=3157225 RepID=UPI00344E05B1